MDLNDGPSSLHTSFDDNDSVEAAIGTQVEYSATAVPIKAGSETHEDSTESNESTATGKFSEANLSLIELPGRKYKYDVPVDVSDEDKGTGFRILSYRRPHMRAFWGTNVAHRATVFMWFSAVPLYSEIQETLNITREDIWASAICAMLGALVGRIIAGLACNKYGARLTSAALIIFSTFPTTLQGAVTNTTNLCLARFFCSLGGGVFVASVCWMDAMFIKDFSARIHGFTGGLGAATGMCQGVLGLMVFPTFTYMTGSKELGWRLSFCFVSLGSLVVGISLIFLTDDTPKGNYAKLKRKGEISPPPLWEAFHASIYNRNIWILSIQHGLNFGTEIAINNALIDYFKDSYQLSNRTSIILASIFPAANQFARIGGGRLSDKAFLKNGMKGRLKCQLGFLFVAGISFIIFSNTYRLWVSLSCLCVMAILLLFSQSATFGIVPYINPNSNQSEFGIVGAGGTAGGIVIGLIFRNLETYREAFCVTGYLILVSSVLTLFIKIPGYGSIFKEDKDTTKNGITSCTTKETHEDGVSIETSTGCANEFVDSMCMVSQPPRSAMNIEDVPCEIKVSRKKRSKGKLSRPAFEKARSESVLVTVMEKERSEKIEEEDEASQRV